LASTAETHFDAGNAGAASCVAEGGVPADLHIFAEAPHGVGLDLRDPSVGMWGELVVEWMRGRGILK
jgi:hypothetical protein